MSFLHHEACPSCGSRDNLGRYADGSAYCFGCHYYERPNGSVDPRNRETGKSKDFAQPPSDCGYEFSSECLSWLEKYGLTVQELYERQVVWSPQRQQLVFLFENGIWQARNFGEFAKTKYFTQGNVNEHLPVYCRVGGSVGDSPTVVLVEDCISAIKIARQQDSMPLLGSNISHQKLYRLKHFYEEAVFWLDSDKYAEAQKLAQRAKLLGLKTKVIFTELDPKEYNDQTIAKLLSS